MKASFSNILFGLAWFLPLYILMLETNWGKRPMIDERDRFSDELFSWFCAFMGVAVFVAMIFG